MNNLPDELEPLVEGVAGLLREHSKSELDSAAHRQAVLAVIEAGALRFLAEAAERRSRINIDGVEDALIAELASRKQSGVEVIARMLSSTVSLLQQTTTGAATGPAVVEAGALRFLAEAAERRCRDER